MIVKDKPKERYWLKQYRKRNGFSAEQVATWCKVSRGHYSMIENGQKNPSMKLAVNIGVTLGFDPARFMNEKGR